MPDGRLDAQEWAFILARTLRAKEEGAVDDTHIVAEIGEVLMGKARGRESDEEITVYKSLGVIAQDLSAATYVWHQAESRGLGTVAEI